MSAEQVSLFGDVDGLFAPPMIECTPPELVELVPGDHVAAMRGELDTSSAAVILDRLERKVTNADRAERIAADRAERLAEIDREHDERFPVDEWDAHPCPTFCQDDTSGDWCAVCGWEAEDHETTPCADCGGPMWPGIDHDCPEPDYDPTDAETLAPEPDADQGWANAFTPGEDDQPAAELHELAHAWHDRHDPRNDDERPDLDALPPGYRYSEWADAHRGMAPDLSHRWPERIPPPLDTAPAGDLFAAASAEAGECTVDGCTDPATHAARFEHHAHGISHPDYGPEAIDLASITYGGKRCCLYHANYFAEAWCPRYPGERNAAWLDIL